MLAHIGVKGLTKSLTNTLYNCNFTFFVSSCSHLTPKSDQPPISSYSITA